LTWLKIKLDTSLKVFQMCKYNFFIDVL